LQNVTASASVTLKVIEPSAAVQPDAFNITGSVLLVDVAHSGYGAMTRAMRFAIAYNTAVLRRDGHARNVLAYDRVDEQTGHAPPETIMLEGENTQTSARLGRRRRSARKPPQPADLR
jgi:hypothetical protein